MQNLKYLKSVINEENRFGVILNNIAVKHTEMIQMKIALTLLEFFNGARFVNENDIQKDKNMFYILKEKYPHIRG